MHVHDFNIQASAGRWLASGCRLAARLVTACNNIVARQRHDWFLLVAYKKPPSLFQLRCPAPYVITYILNTGLLLSFFGYFSVRISRRVRCAARAGQTETVSDRFAGRSITNAFFNLPALLADDRCTQPSGSWNVVAHSARWRFAAGCSSSAFCALSSTRIWTAACSGSNLITKRFAVPPLAA